MRLTPSRVAVALLALAMVACSGPAEWRYRERVESASEPSVHGVHSARLAEVMRGLERLTGDRLPRALDLEAARRGRVDELVAVARAIAVSAENLEPLASELGLSEPDRSEFLQRADGLRDAALRLAERAPGLPPEALRSEATALERHCAGCHERFRIPR